MNHQKEANPLQIAALELVEEANWKEVEARVALRTAQSETACCVYAARDARVTWDQIADVFGISRQAAQQKYADPS